MADSFLPPVVAVLTANIAEYSAKMAQAKGEMAEVEGTAGKVGVAGKAALLGLAAGAVAVGVESVKMASTFDSQMELIATQAHAGQAEVDHMKQAVLDLAPAVGIGPEKLAEGLYHIESTGIHGQQALDILKASAQDAAIGLADLDTVSFAMSGVMSIAMKDVNNAADGVAYLNEIVGTGDMRMQGLAEAVGTGVLPVFKTAGLGMRDFGAALTTLTDNATPPTVAANHLKTAIQLLQNQSKPAEEALAGIGIQSGQLANDLQKPDGLLVAIQDIKTHLEASGKTAAEQGQIMSKAFGGARGAATVEALVQEIDKLKGKYGEMGTAASRAQQFQEDWQHTQDTFKQKMAEVSATVQVWAIQLGEILLPVLSKLADWFISSVSWLNQHKAATEALVAVLGVVLVGATLSALGALTRLAVGVVVGPVRAFASAGTAVWGFLGDLEGGLSGAESAVGTWGGRVGQLLGGVGRGLGAMFQAVGKAASWFSTQMTEVVIPAVVDGVQAMGRAIAQAARWAATQMTEVVIPALVDGAQAMGRFALSMGGALISGIRALGAAIVESVIPALVDAAIATWSFTVALLANPITWIILAIVALGVAIYLLVTHWQQVSAFLTDAWNGFCSWAVGIFNDLANFFSGVWAGIVGIFRGAANAVTGTWNDVMNFLSGIPGYIGGIFSDFGNMLVSAGENLLIGLYNGIVSRASWLYNEVVSWANSIVSGIKGALGIASPSKETYEHGRFLAEGLAAGLDDHAHIAAAAAQRMAASVLGAANPGAVNVTGSAVSGSPVGVAGGGTVVVVNVAGSVHSEASLKRTIQDIFLQHAGRNATNGLSGVRL